MEDWRKEEINYNLNNIEIDKIKEISKLISDKNKNIYFSGIGKCETIAIHIANVLKSLSYKFIRWIRMKNIES